MTARRIMNRYKHLKELKLVGLRGRRFNIFWNSQHLLNPSMNTGLIWPALWIETGINENYRGRIATASRASSHQSYEFKVLGITGDQSGVKPGSQSIKKTGRQAELKHGQHQAVERWLSLIDLETIRRIFKCGIKLVHLRHRPKPGTHKKMQY